MGFRPSEARRLQVSDLHLGTDPDLSTAYIDLPARSSKKKKPRTLGLTPWVRLWLRRPEVEAAFGRIEDRWGNEPLFPNPLATNAEKRWTETSEKKCLARAYAAAGIEHIKPNELGRHFFGTELLNEGADIYRLKEWLGHADIATTERYAKLRPQTAARLFPARGGSDRGSNR